MAVKQPDKGIGPHFPTQDSEDRFDQLLMALADTPEGEDPFPWATAWTASWPAWAVHLRAEIYETGEHQTCQLFSSHPAKDINAWYAAAGKALGAV